MRERFEKPIGSEFFFQGMVPGKGSWFEAGNFGWFSSGRAAVRALILKEGLGSRDEVLMPVYVCRALVQPFVKSGISLRYYGVGTDLRIAPERFEDLVTPRTRALVIVHYFGFPQKILRLKEWASSRGILLIEDCAQALYSETEGKRLGTLGDYGIYSLRKFLAVPDGGVLACGKGEMPAIEARRSEDVVYTALRIGGLVTKSLHVGAPFLFDRKFYDKSFSFENESAERLDTMNAATGISLLSKWIALNTDVKAVVESRRRNFEILLGAKSPSGKWRPFFSELPEGVCPFGFPIVTEEKNSLKKTLVEKRIYGATHWFERDLPDAIGERIFSEERGLPDRMLTLPVDQRYGTEDMGKIVKVLEGV